MDLILNGESQSFDAGDCANLAELVARAESLAGDGPCVVTAVEIDGEPLPADELGNLEVRGIANVKRIAIVRRPRREVAIAVLGQGADYCGQIVGAIQQTVDHYRANRIQQASGVLADILDSISVLTGITASISEDLPTEAKTLSDLQGNIQPWLEAMLEAQVVQDPIQIADLLEYEIAPHIEGWGRAMRSAVPGSALSAAGR
ncbi:MAG: hypothetical protein U0900_00545 [Myxococcota bacterium]